MKKCNDNLSFNVKNERVKHLYKIHNKLAFKKDSKTVLTILKNIFKYEQETKFVDFIEISPNNINVYIEKLLSQNLSLSFISHNLKAIKDFYKWLGFQKGYKNKFNINYADYFTLSNNQRNAAKSLEYQTSYELSEIYKTICNMPSYSFVDRRNKAMISLQYLCGLRISELRTVSLKNIIFDKHAKNYFVFVNPKNMSVKFAKTRSAYFMPFEDEVKDIVLNWKLELEGLGFKDKDPLFPIITNNFNQKNILEPNLKKDFIKSNTSIINIFKKSFSMSGFGYNRPHSFRHTLVRWAETQTPEVFNAVSQSFGHSDIKTTFQSYGALTPANIGKILNKDNFN